MDEEEALRTFYTRMVSSVRSKLPNSAPQCSPRRDREKREKHTKRREEDTSPVSQPDTQDRTDGDPIGFGKRVVRVEDMASDHTRDRGPLSSGQPKKRERYAGKSDLTSHNLTVSQGPDNQLVPPRLVSLLRHKRLMQEMRRALEVELHCPSLCTACEEARASLALDAFIRRKKTQLDAEGRQTLHLCNSQHYSLMGRGS